MSTQNEHLNKLTEIIKNEGNKFYLNYKYENKIPLFDFGCKIYLKIKRYFKFYYY
jgi:hypothetical protein